MNGMIISKRLNNFIQNLYKIKLRLHEKTNAKLQSQNQEQLILLLYQRRKHETFLFCVFSKMSWKRDGISSDFSKQENSWWKENQWYPSLS